MMLKKIKDAVGNTRGDFNLQYAVIVGLTVAALAVIVIIGALILARLEAVQAQIENLSCILGGYAL